MTKRNPVSDLSFLVNQCDTIFVKKIFLVTPKNSIGSGGQLVRICDGKNQTNQLINIQQIPQSIQIIQQNCVINGQNLVSLTLTLISNPTLPHPCFSTNPQFYHHLRSEGFASHFNSYPQFSCPQINVFSR